MAPKEITKLLDAWKLDEELAFHYYEYLLDVEIVTIKKVEDNLFELVPGKSSINIAGPWYKSDLEKTLGRDGLKTMQVNKFGEYWKKSDGCICGAWATGDPDCHAYYCAKYRKY